MKNVFLKTASSFVLLFCLFILFLNLEPNHLSHQPIYEETNIESSSLHLRSNSSSFCSVTHSPYPTTIEQPDGSHFQGILINDKDIIYIETLDGYTILKDEQDGFYKYATRGTEGDLFLTGGQVTDIDARPQGIQTLLQALKPHRRFKGERLQQLLTSRQEKNLDDPLPGGTSAIFPSTGVRKSLLLLIDFPDQPFTYPVGDFDNLANQSGYSVNGATGSFKEYYEDISYGILTVNTDVEGWYTANNAKATYGIQSLENRNFSVAKPLIEEAVQAAEAAGVDFSQYDGDGDGTVDVVEVIHSGRGAEESGSVEDIWSHRSSIPSISLDGVNVRDYIIQAEKYGPTNITNIGVLVHEFGHALGLPDLYDIDGGSEGIGRWCCMAGGTWNNQGKTPAQFSVWCKQQLGWTTPTVLTGEGAISNMDYSNSSSASYRINTSVNSEYFLIENRQQIGWDQYIPGSGLCVFHIDDNQSTNADHTHYKVDLEQADGDSDLNNDVNRGDTGDPFPGSSNQTSIDCNTTPNTNTYNTNSTNINISNIAISNNLAAFDYGYCSADCDILGISVNDGPLNFNGTTYEIELSIGYSFPPGSGTLEVTIGATTVNVAITGSPQLVTITNLPADGNTVNASASFSASPSCQATENNLFTAPFNCDNDDVCDALDITSYIISGDEISCNNIGSTTETNEPKPNNAGCETQNSWCGGSINNTVWFKFTAPASGSINIDFVTAKDFQLAVWEADSCSDILDPSKVMMVAANDDSGSADGYSPRINNLSCLIPGKVYYVQLDGYSNLTDFFSMTINDPSISCDAAPTSGGGCGNDFTATSTGNGEWVHIEDGSGNIIASVNDRFNNLGTITANFAINSGNVRLNADNYPILDRDWYINVANNNSACIRLYLNDAELQALNNAGGASQLSELNLSKINGSTCSNSSGTETYVIQSSNKSNFDGANHMIEFDITGFSGFFPRGNSAILPVELIEFKGTAEKYFNQLKWITATEYNTDQFIIQKLNLNNNNWEDIEAIKAIGFSQQIQAYTWEDKELSPIAYYRIKIVDFDGKIDYSDAISIQRTDRALQILQVFPLPANDYLTIEWVSNKNAPIQIEIWNINGQLLDNQQRQGNKGFNSFQFDVSTLPAGIYVLSINSDEGTVNQKVVID